MSKAFAVFLADAMEERGMTQAVVAKKAGITQSYVNDLLHAREVNPTVRTLAGLSRALRINVFRWFAGTWKGVEEGRVWGGRT